jgi:prepilin-type processing-associated H-X9-DG protein
MTDQIQHRRSDPQVQELTPDELDTVSGGRGANFLLADGSVRNVAAADAPAQQRYTDVPPSS